MASKVQFVIIVDEDNNYVVGHDSEEAWEKFNEDYTPSCSIRVLNCTLTVETPKLIELIAHIPEESTGPITLIAKSK
jgi:hypothetical protein